MNLSSPVLMGVAFGFSELALSLSRRASADAKPSDRHSLLLIWAVVTVALLLGVFATYALPQLALPDAREFYLAGVVIFLLGLTLRRTRFVTWAAGSA